MESYSTNQKIAITLKVVSGLLLFIFCIGLILIIKLFSKTVDYKTIGRFELVGLLVNSFIINLLLVFA